jgi:hypothetical protein
MIFSKDSNSMCEMVFLVSYTKVRNYVLDVRLAQVCGDTNLGWRFYHAGLWGHKPWLAFLPLVCGDTNLGWRFFLKYLVCGDTNLGWL